MKTQHLWTNWIIANAIGELLGLGAAFAVSAGFLANAAANPSVLLSAGVMTTTGAIEGTIVGLAQWAVLRKAIAGITRRAWVVALSWF